MLKANMTGWAKVGVLVIALGLVACGPKKSPQREKAPTPESFQALAKAAGWEMDESDESKAFEEALSAQVTKKAGKDGATIVSEIGVDESKLTKLGLKGKAIKFDAVTVPFGNAAQANIDKTGTDLMGPDGKPAEVKLMISCDAKCSVAGLFLTVTYQGKDKAMTVKAGLGVDFKLKEAGAASQKAQVFMKAKKK